jgi:hypothetical protein
MTLRPISSIRNPQKPFEDLVVYNGTFKSMESCSIIALIVALSRPLLHICNFQNDIAPAVFSLIKGYISIVGRMRASAGRIDRVPPPIVDPVAPRQPRHSDNYAGAGPGGFQGF